MHLSKIKIGIKKKKRIMKDISDILILDKRIKFAYIHGSFINEPIFNDIDVAIYLDDKILKQIDIVNIEIDKSLEIQERIGLPIDIKVLNNAPLSFQYQASSNGVKLFSHDENTLERFLCNTWRDYFDFEPISRMFLKEVLE